MQEDDLKLLIVNSGELCINAAIEAAKAACAKHVAVIIVVDNNHLPSALQQDKRDDMDEETIEPIIMRLQAAQIDPFEAISLTADLFVQNEKLMHKTRKKHMQQRHQHLAHNAFKQTRKPPAHLSRKF